MANSVKRRIAKAMPIMSRMVEDDARLERAQMLAEADERVKAAEKRRAEREKLPALVTITVPRKTLTDEVIATNLKRQQARRNNAQSVLDAEDEGWFSTTRQKALGGGIAPELDAFEKD